MHLVTSCSSRKNASFNPPRVLVVRGNTSECLSDHSCFTSILAQAPSLFAFFASSIYGAHPLCSTVTRGQQMGKTMSLPGFVCHNLNFIFTRKINPSDRLNSVVKANFIGNQSQRGRCHFLQPLHSAISIYFKMIS